MNEDLFGFEGILLDPMDDWVDMPEYSNDKEVKPLYTATFKFRTQEDYEDLRQKLKNISLMMLRSLMVNKVNLINRRGIHWMNLRVNMCTQAKSLRTLDSLYT